MGNTNETKMAINNIKATKWQELQQQSNGKAKAMKLQHSERFKDYMSRWQTCKKNDNTNMTKSNTNETKSNTIKAKSDTS